MGMVSAPACNRLLVVFAAVMTLMVMMIVMLFAFRVMRMPVTRIYAKEVTQKMRAFMTEDFIGRSRHVRIVEGPISSVHSKMQRVIRMRVHVFAVVSFHDKQRKQFIAASAGEFACTKVVCVKNRFNGFDGSSVRHTCVYWRDVRRRVHLEAEGNTHRRYE